MLHYTRILSQSSAGLLIGGAATYPYFVDDICWVKFYPNNNEDYFFEKQIGELNNMDGIEGYYNWVKSKYKYLVPIYRETLMEQIPIEYKYSAGDIIFVNTDNTIGQIEERKYELESNSIVYNIRIIDLNKNSLNTLTYNNVVENNIQLGISALDCFLKFNNNPQAIQAYALYVWSQLKCFLQEQKYDVKLFHVKEIIFVYVYLQLV